MIATKPIRFSAFLLFVCLALTPSGYLFVQSLFEGTRPALAPLTNILLKARQWHLLGNSLCLAGGCALCSIFIGVPLALACERTTLWGRQCWRILLLVPLLIPPYMQALIWSRLGFLFDLHSLAGAVFCSTLAYFPFVSILTIQGLKGMEPSQEEAALLHDGSWAMLGKVTIPLVLPHILSGAMFVFVFALTDFSIADILRVKVYPVEIFIQFSAFYNTDAATLMSVPLIILSMVVLFLQHRLMQGRAYVNFAGKNQDSIRLRLSGKHNVLLSLFPCGVILLAVLIPLVSFCSVAGGWSTYWKVLSMNGMEILYSFEVAAAGSVLMLGLGFFIAVSLERATGFWNTVFNYLVQIPLAVPAIVLGIGLIVLFNRAPTAWIYESSCIVILGYLAHFITFAVRSIQSGLKRMPLNLEEVALLTGHKSLSVLKNIVVPTIRPELLGALFIVFILCMGELGTTLLVVPPGRSTLPNTIYNYMHYGAEEMTAALCLILIVLMLVFSLGVLQFFRHLDKRYK